MESKREKGDGEKARKGKTVIIAVTSFFIIVLDQLTKFFVSRSISEPILVLKNVFHLVYIKNTGAGFGILQNQQPLLLFISLFVVGAIIFYYDKIPNDKLVQLFFGLLLGGAIGNLIDRIRLGYVTDFLDFRVWPAFNIADAAVTIGAIGLAIYFMRKR